MAFGLFASSPSTTVSAATGINHQINFQGKLVSPTGVNVSDGAYSIVFSIYSVSSGGSAIWTETQNPTVTNGIFQVSLGSVTALPGSVDFNTDNIYLGIKVGADAEMTPRIQFTSVPQAFNSEKLGGLDKTGFIQNQTGSTQTADFKISGAGTLGTSLTTPLLQAAAATALTITGNAASTWSTSAGNITLQAGSGTISLGSTTSLTASGALSITSASGANAITLDSGSTGAVNIGTNANAKTITLGNTTGATAVVINSGSGNIALNGNTTISAGSYITLVGGATGTRPASPTTGMLYFDTTTNQMLQYNGSKWNSAPRSTTKIVAASNSSQAIKDAADYVAGATNAETTINTALTAAAGGSVYLAEGTYNVAAAISIPNNTTLFGAGAGTLITIPNAQNGTYNIITNTDTSTGTHVSIHDLQIDGNKANQTSGTMNGIYLVGMGGGSGSTARDGTKLNNVIVRGVYAGDGVYFSGANSQFYGISAVNNGGYGFHSLGMVASLISNGLFQGNANNGGILIQSSSNDNVISNNIVQGNNYYGIYVNGSSGNTITGNTVQGQGIGITIFSGTNDNVSSNTIKSNNVYGIYLAFVNNSIVTGNKIQDSGNTTNNNGVYVSSSPSNTISSNDINDSSCTTDCYAVNINDTTSASNYLANNRHSGTTANPSTIRDLASNTIYANQLDANGNLINRNQGALTVGTSAATRSLTLQGSFSAAQLPTPAAPTLATVGTAGSTSYTYAVSALDGSGETLPSTGTAITTGNATLTGSNYNTISWTQVGGAVQYKVYRTASGGSPASTGLIGTVSANLFTFNDTGIAASGAVAASNTTANALIAGNVGIGNTAPSVALDVGPLSLGASQIVQTRIGDFLLQSSQAGANGLTTLTSRGSNGNMTLDVAAAGNGIYIGNANAANVLLAPGGGKVGVGNTGPTVAFDVGPLSLGAAQLLQSRFGDILLQTTQGASNGITASSSRGSNGNLTIDAAGSGNGIYIGNANTASVLLAPGLGKVGVGNSAPSVNLDVGPLSLGAAQTVQTRIGDILIQSQQGGNNGFSSLTSRGSNGNLLFDSASGSGTYLNSTNTNNVYLASGGGKVGVGTTSLSSTFTVSGTTLLQTAAANSTTAFQIQNNSSATLFNADTTNQRVGIATNNASNTFSVSPVQYATGTAGTGGSANTTVTGVGTTWTAAMVNSEIVFANGQKATITGFISTTSITVSPSVTVSNGTAYVIQYVGLQVNSSGAVGIGNSAPDSPLSVQAQGQNAVVNIYGIGAATDYGVIQVSSLGNLTNASNRPLIIQPNAGKVGIGAVTAPTSTLQVVGDISGTNYISTIATGTAPFTVASTTKVTNLNADLLDGLDSTAFGDATAANQTTILNRIGTNADAAGTTTLFARLARIDDTDLGATADAANSGGTIFARLTDLFNRVSTLNTNVGSDADAASATGSVHAKLKDIKASLSAGGKTQYIQTFTASGTWTKPAGVSVVDVVVVGGGGGGGVSYFTPTIYGGGGGGGGGVTHQTVSVSANVSVTIGAGGAASSGGDGGNGSASSFGTITAGGGFGGLQANGSAGGNGGMSGSYNPGAAGGNSCNTSSGISYGGQSPSDVGLGLGGKYNASVSPGSSGAANTGNGGDGGKCGQGNSNGGAGGSGVVIVTWWQ